MSGASALSNTSCSLVCDVMISERSMDSGTCGSVPTNALRLFLKASHHRMRGCARSPVTKRGLQNAYRFAAPGGQPTTQTATLTKGVHFVEVGFLLSQNEPPLVDLPIRDVGRPPGATKRMPQERGVFVTVSCSEVIRF